MSPYLQNFSQNCLSFDCSVVQKITFDFLPNHLKIIWLCCNLLSRVLSNDLEFILCSSWCQLNGQGFLIVNWIFYVSVLLRSRFETRRNNRRRTNFGSSKVRFDRNVSVSRLLDRADRSEERGKIRLDVQQFESRNLPKFRKRNPKFWFGRLR